MPSIANMYFLAVLEKTFCTSIRRDRTPIWGQVLSPPLPGCMALALHHFFLTRKMIKIIGSNSSGYLKNKGVLTLRRVRRMTKRKFYCYSVFLGKFITLPDACWSLFILLNHQLVILWGCTVMVFSIETWFFQPRKIIGDHGRLEFPWLGEMINQRRVKWSLVLIKGYQNSSLFMYIYFQAGSTSRNLKRCPDEPGQASRWLRTLSRSGNEIELICDSTVHWVYGYIKGKS